MVSIGRGRRSGSNAPLSVDFDHVAGKIVHDTVDLYMTKLVVSLGSGGRYANFRGIWRSGSEVFDSCCV